MKKIFLMSAAIATLIFTSCSKSEVTEGLGSGSKLSFRVNSGKTTRAGLPETKTGDLVTAGTLNLYPFDTGLTPVTFPGYSSASIVLNYSAGSSSWAPAQDVYLATGFSYPISLYSAYPSSYYSGTGTSFDFDTDAESNIDLLVANAEIANTETTSVSVEYTHALAQLAITVRYINGHADTYASITNIATSGVPVSGTYHFTSNVWESVLYSRASIQDVTNLAPSDVPTDMMANRFIIPTTSEQTLTFDWGIFSNTNNALIKGGNNYVINFNTIPFLAGYRYQIDIIIDGTLSKKITTWTVSVKDFEDAPGKPVEIRP